MPVGHDVVYCAKCGLRLTAPEFERGKAHRVGGLAYCAPCLPSAVGSLPPDRLAALLKPPPPPAPAAPAPPAAAEPPKTRRRVLVQGRPAGVLWGVVGAAAALLVVVAVALSSRPEPAPAAPKVARPEPVPKPERAEPPPPPPSAPDLRERAAAEALQKARAFLRTHPKDARGQRDLFQKALDSARSTRLWEEAQREWDAALRREKEAFEAELAPLDAEVARASEREEFRRALSLLEKARAERPDRAWTALVDARVQDLNGRAELLYASLEPKLRDARARGAQGEIRAMGERVRGWGIETWVARLERELAAVVPPPPPPPAPPAAEPSAYPGLWEKAMAHAAARDYAAAARELEGARPSLPESARAEASRDVSLLQAAEALHAEAVKALARTPRGRTLAVSFFDEQGKVQTAEGRFVAADAARLELSSGGRPVWVEVGELQAASLLEALGPRKDQAAALICLLEGDRSRGAADLPEKYREYARADVPPKEAEARALFYAARKESASPTTLFGSFAKLQALRSDYADVPFVRRNRASLLKGLEAARDYVLLPGDIRIAGKFAPARLSSGEGCLAADSSKETYAEGLFFALADAEYRAWVYVGGCCGETESFTVQGADLPSALAFENPLKRVTKSHSSHRAGQAPKWGWVPVALPKYAAAGVKSLRLVPASAGFHLRSAVVTAVRANPPRDAELRDLAKARGEEGDASRARSAHPRDAALVAYLRFDEGAGTVAADGSDNRNGGILHNGAAWAAGHVGRAVSLDGSDDYVQVENSTSLESLSKQLTVAAWVNVQAGGREQVIVGRHTGLPIKEQFQIYVLRDNRPGLHIGTTSGEMGADGGVPVPVGQWFHLAGTYDGSTLRVFVNGAEAASVAHAGDLKPTKMPLSVGGLVSQPDRQVTLAFKGLVDELFLYTRALTVAEIRTLAGAGR